MQTERTFIDDLKHRYKYGGMSMRLIFINVAIFLVIRILDVFFNLSGAEGFIGNYLIGNVALLTGIQDFITHPWGLFTSMFVHYDFFHIAFNMIFLYWSGRLFEQLFDQKRLLYTYLLGGIFGGVLEIIAHAIFPAFGLTSSIVVGASGAIMAIFVAVAFYRPNLKLNFFGLFEIRVIYVALIFILKDLLSLGSDDLTAHFAHLGGAILGMISVQNIHSSGNIVNRMQQFGDWILSLFSGSGKPKMKVKRGSGSSTRAKTDEEYNIEAKAKQEQVDRILDKISKSGYESLSKKEKDFLFNQSKK